MPSSNGLVRGSAARHDGHCDGSYLPKRTIIEGARRERATGICVKAWGSRRNDLKLLALQQFDRHCSKNRLGESRSQRLVLWRQRSRMAKVKKQTSRGQ